MPMQFVAAAGGLAAPARAYLQPWDHMGGWGWGMGFFGLVLMALLVALVVWLVVAGTRRDGAAPGPSRSRALDLLDERFARGEIERDEYLQKKADLQR